MTISFSDSFSDDPLHTLPYKTWKGFKEIYEGKEIIGTRVPPGFRVIPWHVFRFYQGGPGSNWSWGHRPDIFTWCADNIKGSWAHVPPGPPNHHTFFIQDAKDAMLFKLTWGGQ